MFIINPKKKVMFIALYGFPILYVILYRLKNVVVNPFSWEKLSLILQKYHSSIVCKRKKIDRRRKNNKYSVLIGLKLLYIIK
jgi:hypothetical protein